MYRCSILSRETQDRSTVSNERKQAATWDFCHLGHCIMRKKRLFSITTCPCNLITIQLLVNTPSAQSVMFFNSLFVVNVGPVFHWHMPNATKQLCTLCGSVWMVLPT